MLKALLDSFLHWFASASIVHDLEAHLAPGDDKGVELISSRDLVMKEVRMVRREWKESTEKLRAELT